MHFASIQKATMIGRKRRHEMLEGYREGALPSVRPQSLEDFSSSILASNPMDLSEFKNHESELTTPAREKMAWVDRRVSGEKMAWVDRGVSGGPEETALRILETVGVGGFLDGEGVAVSEHWYRFPLAVERRARALNVSEEWDLSFHGVKSSSVLRSALECGQLLRPGDKLMDGKMLRSTKCAGRQPRCIYTSPELAYAGLRFYAEPQRVVVGDVGFQASVVLECRQRPGSYRTQGETMRFAATSAEHRERTFADMTQIEWFTDNPVTVMLTAVLVRFWESNGTDPHLAKYSSPVDPMRLRDTQKDTPKDTPKDIKAFLIWLGAIWGEMIERNAHASIEHLVHAAEIKWVQLGDEVQQHYSTLSTHNQLCVQTVADRMSHDVARTAYRRYGRLGTFPEKLPEVVTSS